jgi:hypothetical protein
MMRWSAVELTSNEEELIWIRWNSQHHNSYEVELSSTALRPTLTLDYSIASVYITFSPFI